MSPSEFDAITAVELAIVASEGETTVDGVDYPTPSAAATARRTLAFLAVAQSSLLRRYIAIRPPCPWCGCEIGPDDASVLLRGRRLHNTESRPCMREYDCTDDPYAPGLLTPTLWLERGH